MKTYRDINYKRLNILISLLSGFILLFTNYASLRKDYIHAKYAFRENEDQQRKAQLSDCLIKNKTTERQLKEENDNECSIKAAQKSGGGALGLLGYHNTYYLCVYSKVPECSKYAFSQHKPMNITWYLGSSYSFKTIKIILLMVGMPIALALSPKILKSTFNWLTKKKE